MLPMALHFAWGDTKARYRRSVLGPFWIVLGTGIGVAGLGYLWSAILGVEHSTLVPSLTMGLVIWQLLTGVIVEAATTFPRYAQIVRNMQTPFAIFPVQLLTRQLINFAHNFVVVALVMAIYVRDYSWVQLLFFPNLILVCLNLLWISLLVAILGARFRDLELLIASIMPMLFFLSPVIYRPENLQVQAWLLLVNPLAYFIEGIRDPLIGMVPDWHIYAGLIGMAVVGWSVALWLLNSKHSRIAFWV